MNKREATAAAARLTAWSLRRLSRRPEQWDSLPLPKGLTEAQRKKLAAAMVDLADKLEARYTPKEIDDAGGSAGSDGASAPR